MAQGGDVNFCNTDRVHNKECQYFSDGGPVDFDSLQEDPAPIHDSPPDAIPKFDDLKDDSESQSHGSFDSLVDDSDKYSSTGQQVAAGLEGAAQGVLGPLAPIAEMAVGIPKKDIAAREKANPWVHGLSETAGLAGSMFVGTGEAALAAKAAEATAKIAELGKVGSAAIKGIINTGLIKGSDEVSKWLLGEGDPEHPIAAGLMNTGAAALIGGSLGGAGALASKGLETLADTKVANKLYGYLAGIGNAAQNPAAERDLSNAAFKSFFDNGLAPKGMTHADFLAGQHYFDNGLDAVTKSSGPAIGAFIGKHVAGDAGETAGMLAGNALSKKIGGAVEKIVVPAARKYVTPVVLKMLGTGNTEGLMEMFDYARNVGSGYGAMNKAIDSLFKAGTVGISNAGADKSVDKIDDWIKSGGTSQEIQQNLYDENDSPQHLAKGGMVKALAKKPTALETHYPEQNVLLNIARGRVSNYLSSLRPGNNQPKLAFDEHPDTRAQQKSYHKALNIAAKPLSVLDEIKNGTVEPEHVQHLNSMYPEVNNLLQKKLTEKITQSQLNGDRPSSKVRQGLSLFMGTPLSGELQPQSIQAIQAVFANKKPQPQGQGAPKSGSPSKLSKSDQSFLTGGQALQRRAQKV